MKDEPGLILIPEQPGKPAVHVYETARSLAKKIGVTEVTLYKKIKFGKPVTIKGERYYVDYEL